MSKRIEGHGDGKYRKITVYPPLGDPKTWHPPFNPLDSSSNSNLSWLWEVTDDEGNPGDSIITLTVNVETGTAISWQTPKDEMVQEAVEAVEEARRGER